MKIKIFAFFVGTFFLTGCSSDVGTDNLFSDSTFNIIPKHDSIDCLGSCTIKIYNRD